MNIKDIAEKAGVSTAAVSRYFNNGYVSEKKNEAIRKVVEKYDYHPSMQAQTLRTRKTNMIGVVIPRIDSSSIARVVEGIMEAAEAEGYQVLLALTMNEVSRELEYLSIFHDKQVDGVILLGTFLSDDHMELLKSMKVPVVIVGQKLEGYNSVYHDDYHAEYDITKLLLDRGRRNLVYIGVTHEDKAVGQARYRGFRDAVHDAGFDELAERRVISGFDAKSGFNCMRELMEKYDDVDAVVAATDTIASGAIRYLHKLEIKIPDDVMVVGQGDSQLARVLTPELTTVRYYYEESGKNAVEMLVDNLKADGEDVQVRMVKLGYELVERETT